MIRFMENSETAAGKEYRVFYNQDIWKNIRSIFSRCGSLEQIAVAVVDEKQNVLCYAYDDREANRELRMLSELQGLSGAEDFKTLHREIKGAVIYGCNELAYYFAEYLRKLGIKVWTVGKYWDLFGYDTKDNSWEGEIFKVYAEGAENENCNVQERLLKSVSAEFECIDEIYECNYKKGLIQDNDGTFEDLVKRLKAGGKAVLCGTGTECQDAYDLLYFAGIDIACFMSEKAGSRLLGKPVYDKEYIKENISNPVFIQCSGVHSAAGGYGVDEYAYEGYIRNAQYILLKDYTEIPVSGLRHVLRNKQIVLLGEGLLCGRIKKYLERNGITPEEDIAAAAYESAGETAEYENAICLWMVPPEYLSAAYKGHCEVYRKLLQAKGITDFTDYFSRTVNLAQLPAEEEKFTERKLKPAGILIGCSAAYSGNILLNNVLDNHPNIMMIPEYNFLSKQIFSVCIRLAEEKPANILDAFWDIYKEEAGEEAIAYDFPDKEVFCSSMEEFLLLKSSFSSQEIFVMLFMAYERMYGRSFSIPETYIYWEPHNISREISSKYGKWLWEEGVDVWLFRLVRNNYLRVGSSIKDADLSYQFAGRERQILFSLLDCPAAEMKEGEPVRILEYKFEDLKLNPRQVLENMCADTGIPWADTLLETTMHGRIYYYHGNVTTGFDLKPVYNTFEKYLSEYDRMRIALLAVPYQRKFGYPWVDFRDFSRRELQEMFLKAFRFEAFLNLNQADAYRYRMEIYRKCEDILWRLRCQEIWDAN